MELQARLNKQRIKVFPVCAPNDCNEVLLEPLLVLLDLFLYLFLISAFIDGVYIVEEGYRERLLAVELDFGVRE